MRKKAFTVGILVAAMAAVGFVPWGGKTLVGWAADQVGSSAPTGSFGESLAGRDPHLVAEQVREIWRLAEAGHLEALFVFPEAGSGDTGLGSLFGPDDLAEIQQSAAKGLPWGLVRLAARYRDGDGVEQNLAEARRLFLEAAQKGHLRGHLGLAELYFDGEGVPQSYEKALEHFRLAAEVGGAEAQRRLGEMYRDGLGVEASDEEAVRWLRLASQQDDTAACLALADLLLEGRSGDLGGTEVAECLPEAAAWGSAEAQWKLGLLFAAGAGLDEKFSTPGAREGWQAQSLEWFRKAAAQGHDEAIGRVAEHYLTGTAEPRALVGLSSWPGAWSELEDADVLNNLGVWVVSHNGGWDNIAWALGHARVRGDARAELNLGLVYLEGEVVEASTFEALRHLRNAAVKGLPEAMNELGVCYATGRGVRADLGEAITWYRKAAEAGDANAQFNLAMLYVHGKGVEQDYREALRWLDLAAAEGDPVAVGVRDRVAELVEAKTSLQAAS